MPELEVSPDIARQALAAVLRSRNFIGAERRKKLLEYLVNETLAGRGDELKEFNIGVEVYGRDPATYDPRLDPMVRVDICRVRAKLKEYYQNEGQRDPVTIELPKGSYAASFSRTGTAAESVLEPSAAVERKIPQGVRLGAVMRKHLPLLATLAVIILGAAAYGVYRWSRVQAALQSVVVLPFQNLTGDPQKEYLADGITEQLTDSLAHIPDLRVVARTSAFQFKGKGMDIRQIGRRVDADAVVEGSIRTLNGAIQLTVQIDRCRDGYHIVSQTFDGPFQELPRLEGDLVLPVLAALRPGVKLAKHNAVDPEAYDLFLKARALRADPSRASFEKAITYLNQAIQRDPTYADAYAALATGYASAAGNFAPEPLAYAQKAKAAAAAALRLDPLCAPAYAAEGFVDSMILLDWTHGQKELEYAVRLMPQNAGAHNRLGVVLLAQGRFEEAIAEEHTAEKLDALSPVGVAVGLAYYMARRYDEALSEFLRVRDLNPGFVAVHPFIGTAWEAKGEYRKAMAEYQLALPKIPTTKSYIAHLLAVTGKRDQARAMVRQMEHAGPGETTSAFDVAAIYAALGDRDKAFEWLDRAYRDRIIWFVKVHPMLDPIRSDPRYPALLKKAGLAN